VSPNPRLSGRSLVDILGAMDGQFSPVESRGTLSQTCNVLHLNGSMLLLVAPTCLRRVTGLFDPDGLLRASSILWLTNYLVPNQWRQLMGRSVRVYRIGLSSCSGTWTERGQLRGLVSSFAVNMLVENCCLA
jgi:hypothetical protein